MATDHKILKSNSIDWPLKRPVQPHRPQLPTSLCCDISGGIELQLCLCLSTKNNLSVFLNPGGYFFSMSSLGRWGSSSGSGQSSNNFSIEVVNRAFFATHVRNRFHLELERALTQAQRPRSEIGLGQYPVQTLALIIPMSQVKKALRMLAGKLL